MAELKHKDAAAPNLLLRVEQVKYRKAGPGKSPLGTLFVYEDCVEWAGDADKDDQLLVPFSRVKGQRISPPNKSKVQLQLCMLNEDQATFVFMNATHSQEQLLQERDLVKETLQQALVRHRQTVNQLAKKAARGGPAREQEAKIRILEQNAHLHDMYVHLVREKLLSPQDFWSLHYKPEEKEKANGEEERVGISGGFLSSIVQSEGINGGIRLNLTTETIQSIFRTYPAVERKHLELVPHEMTEQEFWSKFFQSHYFHRERNPAPDGASSSKAAPADDTFADCVQMDEKDMRELVSRGERSMKRHLNLEYIDEDLGIVSEMRANQLSVRGSSNAKRLLVRRCNYHSERVLETVSAVPDMNGLASNRKDQPPKNGSATTAASETNPTQSTSTGAGVEFDLELESRELAEVDRDAEQYSPLAAYNPPKRAPQCAAPAERERARKFLLSALQDAGSVMDEKNQVEFFDMLSTHRLGGDAGCEQPASGDVLRERRKVSSSKTAPFQGLSRPDLERVRTVHACMAELLRHFWQCFPPRTPELEQKIYRMHETLGTFEQNQLADCERKYGSIHVQHCKDQLALARQRFQAFSAAAKRPK